MSRSLLERITSPLYSSSRHVLKSSPQIPKPNPKCRLPHPLSSSLTPSNIRFFCSEKKDDDVIIPPIVEKFFPGIRYYDNEEFDKIAEDFMNGNKEMIPILINAVMAREVSGRHVGAVRDKEVMKELRREFMEPEPEERDWGRYK